MTKDLLRDLAIAKATFQLRAIKTAMGIPQGICRVCGKAWYGAGCPKH